MAGHTLVTARTGSTGDLVTACTGSTGEQYQNTEGVREEELKGQQLFVCHRWRKTKRRWDD